MSIEYPELTRRRFTSYPVDDGIVGRVYASLGIVLNLDPRSISVAVSNFRSSSKLAI